MMLQEVANDLGIPHLKHKMPWSTSTKEEIPKEVSNQVSLNSQIATMIYSIPKVIKEETKYI